MDKPDFSDRAELARVIIALLDSWGLQTEALSDTGPVRTRAVCLVLLPERQTGRENPGQGHHRKSEALFECAIDRGAGDQGQGDRLRHQAGTPPRSQKKGRLSGKC